MEYSFYSFIILAWSPYFPVFSYFFRSRHLPSVHSLIAFMTFRLILGTLANHLKVQLRNMSTAHLTSLELAILKSCHQIVKLIYKLLRSDHHWKCSSLNKKKKKSPDSIAGLTNAVTRQRSSLLVSSNYYFIL